MDDENPSPHPLTERDRSGDLPDDDGPKRSLLGGASDLSAITNEIVFGGRNSDGQCPLEV